MLIAGMLVFTSVALTITYLSGIERQNEFMVILHVISGILYILVVISITVKEKQQQQQQQQLK